MQILHNFHLEGRWQKMINVGEIIRSCRKKVNWSQEQLAFEMNMTQSTISRMEKNKVACDVNTLMDIAHKTNAPDVVMSMMFSIDMSVVAQLFQAIPMVSSWGIFLWFM